MAEKLDLTLEDEEEEDTQKCRYLTFYSGDEGYGIAIQYVSEIIGMQMITKIPEVEKYIIGLINLRGKIIPVIDVRIRFKKEPREYNDRTCIVVIEVKEVVVGIIVDTISEVVTIPDEDVLPPPMVMTSGTQNRYISGIGKIDNAVKLIVDPAKLIQDSEFEIRPEEGVE